MKRILHSVDRWGPGVVSLLTLFLFAILGWWYSAKVARLEGQLTALQHQSDTRADFENSLRTETSALRNWCIAVHERGSAAGWKLPDLPLTPTIDREEKQAKQGSKKPKHKPTKEKGD